MNRVRLVLVAALAVSCAAIATTPANASFRLSKTPVKVLGAGAGTQTIGLGGSAKVECTESTFSSNEEITTTESEQTKVSASYGKCSGTAGSLKGISTTVQMNGCIYNFHLSPKAKEGTVTLECPKGQSMRIKLTAIGSCELELASGESVNHKLGKYEIVVLGVLGGMFFIPADLAGLTTKVVSGSESGCKLLEIAGTKEGTYKGEIELMGANSGGEEVSLELV